MATVDFFFTPYQCYFFLEDLKKGTSCKKKKVDPDVGHLKWVKTKIYDTGAFITQTTTDLRDDMPIREKFGTNNLSEEDEDEETADIIRSEEDATILGTKKKKAQPCGSMQKYFKVKFLYTITTFVAVNTNAGKTYSQRTKHRLEDSCLASILV